ncbi:MAG: hypothetical protein OEN02_12910 [Gammaproteobacteria bacterium]|nr:hypothetical protein [Gammaproteobacteria bacterium]
MKFTKPLLITKLKATAIHLCMSLAVFVYLVYQIYYNWYPQPYFEVDGGWQGIRLVAAVDLVLGPLITFLIFDLRKSRREILFDLLTIVVIQFGALAYGVYATYTQRPVAIVMIDEFVLSAIPQQYGGRLKSLEDLRQYSDEHPPIIFAEMPTTEEGIAEINRIKLEEQVLEHAQLNLYRPKAKLKQALRERQVLFGDRLDYYDERDSYRTWLQQNKKSEDEVLIAPFGGRYGRIWLVFDLEGNYLSYFR